MQERAMVPAPATARFERFDRWAPALAGIIAALPFLVFASAPMIDFPLHEATVAALRHFDDARAFPPGLYGHNFGHANQLFLLVAWGLSYVLPVDLACRACLAATMLLIPIAGARLARHVGASPWIALLLVPIELGWLLSWGLLANLTGLAALFALAPELDEYVSAPSRRGAAVVAASIVLVYFAHGSAVLVYAALAGVFALGYPLAEARSLARLAPAVGGLGIAALDVVRTKALSLPTRYTAPDATAPLGEKLGGIPTFLYGGVESPYLLLLVSAALVAIVAIRRRPAERQNSGGSGDATFRTWLRRHRFALASLACFLAYLVAPLNVKGTTYLYQRFLAPAFYLGVVAFAAGAAPPTRAARLVGCVLPLLSVEAIASSFALASDNVHAVDSLLGKIEPGSAVAQLDLGAGEAHVRFGASPAARALMFRGGRLLFSFLDSPLAPVLVDQRYEWDEPTKRMRKNPFALMPSHDFTRFRYLLAYTPNPVTANAVRIALDPDARLLGTADDWLLFESRKSVVDCRTPDVPLPEPAPETLHARVQAAFDQLKPAVRPTLPAL